MCFLFWSPWLKGPSKEEILGPQVILEIPLTILASESYQLTYLKPLAAESVVMGSSQIARSWCRVEAVMIMADGQTLLSEFTVPVPNI